jgi:hypothetical protein
MTPNRRPDHPLNCLGLPASFLPLYKSVHTLDLPSGSASDAVVTVTMTPSETNYPIPPNNPQYLIPNLSAMPLQSRQPSSQLHRSPGSLLSSHVHPPPAPAFLLPHHPAPLVSGPSGAVPTVHVHGHYVPGPVLSHHLWGPTAPPPPLQIFGPEVQVPNPQAREATAAGHEYM